MPSVKRTDQPCAILFVDMFGSTALYEALGNARGHAAVAETLSLICEATARHCGDVIKTLGDGAMCVFSSAREAMEATTDMQQWTKRAPALVGFAEKAPALRGGFHY